VMEDSEVIEDINVADSDVLLYEVQAHLSLKKNDCFAFIPRKAVEKQKVRKGEALLKS